MTIAGLKTTKTTIKWALKERYDLIARILNSRIENEGLEEYHSVLNNEFLEFASGVDSLKEKEIALLELQEIKKELQLVAGYPSLFQKTIVAVGGGFSAGKSTFLNSLLGLKLKLPEDTLPTTAIPTYCFKGKKEVLMGFSQNAGMVELSHLTFDHNFLNSLGFNLKEIMPLMFLSAPSVPFEFLCFIDTPGYNPSNQGYTSGDKQASKEYLKHAKHILWLISCERGGIEGDDLEYLQELYEEGKEVFIVVSRADRCIKKQLEEIAIQIKETLEDHGIEFLGQVINSFKESIDKVFDRASAFTFEKYKEENDDENDDEENYRKFEEIKKMVLFFRDCALFFLDCYDLNKKQIKEAREEINSCNELLQLDYSLANLSRLREFKEEEDEDYQEFLNNEELQNELREWRNGDKPGFFESIFNDLFGK
ncbi:hypothetical protein BD0138_14450 [Helicobacter pylori]